MDNEKYITIISRCIFILLIIVVFVFYFMKSPLSEEFKGINIEKQIMQDISLLNSSVENPDKIEDFYSRCSQELKLRLQKQRFTENIKADMNRLGSFKSLSDIKIYGTISKYSNKNTAVCNVKAKYENYNLKYYLEYDKSMKLLDFSTRK